MDRQEVMLLFILGFVLYLAVKFYKESDYLQLKCIISDIDGDKYCIRDREKSKEAVNLLAKTVHNMKQLVEYIKKNEPDHPITIRLVNGFNPKKCIETLPTNQHKAFSENKGEKLAFCLNKQNDNNLELIDENTLMFVALHELAHIGTEEVGHTDQYWSNFKWILKQAVVIHIYKPIDYKKTPQNYCGMDITDNPYYNN